MFSLFITTFKKKNKEVQFSFKITVFSSRGQSIATIESTNCNPYLRKYVVIILTKSKQIKKH